MLTSAQLAALQAKATRLAAALEVAYSTYERLIEKEISEYELDTGEAKQRARRIKMSEIQEQIEWLEGQINATEQKIAGNPGQLLSLNVRRR